jgi:hypothetical protein
MLVEKGLYLLILSNFTVLFKKKDGLFLRHH